MGWGMLEQGSLSKIRNSPLQTLSSTESRSPWRKPHYTLIRKSTGQESAVSHEEEGGTGHNSFTREVQPQIQIGESSLMGAQEQYGNG